MNKCAEVVRFFRGKDNERVKLPECDGLSEYEALNTKEDGEKKEQEKVEGHLSYGLTVLTATVFMVGEMAGTGVLAMPKALEDTGYMGVIIILVLAIASAYVGAILAKCWIIIQDRYDEFKGHVREPYPVIGQVAYGKFGRILVSFCVNFTMLGSTIVFLILASQNIQGVLANLCGVNVSFCYLQILVAVVLCPVAWLGTPKDFWPVAVGAASATSFACVILVAAMLEEYMGEVRDIPVVHKNPVLIDLFPSMGIVMFAYGGHPVFPTFQADMKVPGDFPKAVIYAYIAQVLMYVPVAVTGALVYGKAVQANLLLSISPGPLLYTVQILVTCHLVCSFIICLNPVAQQLEELLKLKKTFSWHRIVSRSLLVAFVLFAAETLPKFDTLLSLIGGSTITMMAFVCPPLFYLKLCSMKGHWPQIVVPLHQKVLLLEILIVGSVVGLMSTFSSLQSMASPDSFTVPCYINMTAACG